MNDLLQLVKEMRDLQKEYFKCRNKDILIASKVAEKKVDEAVARLQREQYINNMFHERGV